MALCIVSLQVLSAGFAGLGGHAGQMSRETHSMLMLERRNAPAEMGDQSLDRSSVALCVWALATGRKLSCSCGRSTSQKGGALVQKAHCQFSGYLKS
jgi:hypothetical protein